MIGNENMGDFVRRQESFPDALLRQEGVPAGAGSSSTIGNGNLGASPTRWVGHRRSACRHAYGVVATAFSRSE